MKLTRFVLPFALIPGAALADLTPQDVWDNMSAAYAAGGMTLEGNPENTGSTLAITDAVIRVTYPIVGGSATMTLPAMTLTDLGDGTVSIETPATYVMEMAAEIPGEDGLVTANIAIAQTGATSVASGDPGDVTYTSSAETMDLLINDLTVPGEEVSFEMEIDSEGYVSTTRVTEGDNLTVVSDITNNDAKTRFIVDAGFMKQESTNSSGVLQTRSTIVLPPDMNILDLTPALMAGLSFTGTSESGPSNGTTLTYIDGELSGEQSQNAGDAAASFSIDANGIGGGILAEWFEFTVMDQTVMPFPISGSGGNVTADFQIPLVASDTPQDFKYAFGIKELAIDEGLWGMFDPGNALDRSPADLTLDLSGSLNWGLNVLNIQELMALETADTSPITINSLSINDLGLAALGATAKAVGAFTFDNADMETIPGMPRPEGTATVSATGINAAIDQLIAAGLIPEEEAMMPRMMMGMFARVVGDDALETVVEVNPEGHVIVNGQRMR